MHICQEGSESNNLLPQTRDVGPQGAKMASNVVNNGIIHGDAKPSDCRSGRGLGGRECREGSLSCRNVGLILGNSGLQGQHPCVRLAH